MVGPANDGYNFSYCPDDDDSAFENLASGQYEKLYPSLAGPTMILNLPRILQAFVALFKPLFPKSVQARLKFERAPVLSKLGELTALVDDSDKRKAFLSEIEYLLNDPDDFFATKGRL